MQRAAGEPLAVQRACGTRAIGSPAGCSGVEGDVLGEPFFFKVNCDTLRRPPGFSTDEEARLASMGPTLSAGETIGLHGFASSEGNPTYNENLACARAIKAMSVLTPVAPPVRFELFTHGATAGTRDLRRSVVVDKTPPPGPTPAAGPCKVPANPDMSGTAFNPSIGGDTDTEVAIKHPRDALTALGARDDAFAAAGSSGLAGPHLGRQDAFRHCIWSCLMSQRIGTTRAEQIGTGHENADPTSIPFDNEMDRHDNAVGRSLGRPGADCSAECMDAATTGQLRTIRGPDTNPQAVPPIPTACIGASDQPWP